MAMSKEAAEGLRAAVEYNPEAAQYLMNCLRFLPIGVRYKEQDRYGPLTLMISTFGQTMKISNQVSIPLRNIRPFPQEKLKFCEIFNEEWLQHHFSKQELADAIEQILNEIGPQRPLLETFDDSATLILTAEGTFLSQRETIIKIDPEQQE